MKKMLLGYRRKSMVRDRADLISPERQTRACDLWVEMHGDEYIIEWYEDVEGHRSGRQEKGRPGWQRLLTQLDRPEVAGVIADSFDRMYRNVHQFLNFLNRIELLSKKLVTVKEGLDTSSTLGRAIVTILMVIYQLESDQTSDRMAANVKYKREVLGRHWGPAPFGCDRNEEGQLVPTSKIYWLNLTNGESKLPPVNGHGPDPLPTEGWEARRFYDSLVAAAQLYAEGVHSYDDVAAMANAAGWRYGAESKKHQPRLFTRDDIRRMASFWRLYKGELPLGNITNTKNATILPGGHNPILPVELCERMGIVKAKRGGNTWNRAGEDKRLYILSDVIYCAACQRKLKGYFQNGHRLYRHYGAKQGCPEKWILADNLEAQVIGTLVSLAQNELLKEISAEAERLARELFAQNNSTSTILSDLDRQRDRLTKLEDMYLDGDIDKERYRQRKGELHQAIAALEDQLYTTTQTINFNQVYDRIISTLTHLAAAAPETQKTLINSIIERLDIGGGQVLHLTPRPWAKPFF